MAWNDVTKTENSNSDFMVLAQGDNKVRIVSEPEARDRHWLGKRPIPCMGSCTMCADGTPIKRGYLFHAIDREDGEFKLLGVGPMIANQLKELMTNEEYGFKSVPDYDITIKRTGQMLDTEYSVLPARKNTELTEEELKKLAELTPIADVVKALNKADIERAEKEPPIDRSNVAKDMTDMGFESDSESTQLKDSDIPF